MVTDPVETDIATTYFDTVDLRLAARQITVRAPPPATAGLGSAHPGRRRPGHPRCGPSPGPRIRPCRPELAELVRGSVRDKDLAPVASVRTVRVERRLLDADGRELARVA